MIGFTLCTFWALLLAVAQSETATNQLLSEEYLLQADKIDLFFQRAALMAVLKAKARRLINSVDYADSVVYLQCAANAKTPVTLAQCVVSLMLQRDRKQAETNTVTEDPWQTNWFRELKRLLWPSADTGQRSNVDSSRGSTIYAPLVDSEKQRLVNRFRDDIHRLVKTKHDEEEEHTTSHSRRLFAAPPIQPRPTTRPFSQRVSSTTENSEPEPKTRWPAGMPHESGKLANFLRRRDLFSSQQNRRKRSTDNQTLKFPNIQNLRRIEKFFAQSSKCASYVRRLQEANGRFLRKLNTGIRFDAKPERSLPEQLKSELDTLLAPLLANRTFSRFSILSPRFLSFFPETISSPDRPSLLSPSLLGFHDNGNLFALPRLLKMATSDDSETLQWIELLMQWSGVGNELSRFLERSAHELHRIETEVYPRILRLESWERRFKTAMRTVSSKQEEEMKKFGYAFLERRQANRLFRKTEAAPYAYLTAEQRERQWESRIKEIARLNLTEEHFLNKRQAPPYNSGNPNDGIGYRHEQLHLLTPYIFVNHLNDSAVLEGLILSPHAMITEILHPELLTYDVLSPRAMIATIISPQALVSRTLSPAAFRAEILSPTALYAYTLSPEALITKILSPAALEARIHSSEAITLLVLSPTFLSPKISSAEAYSLIVLSPRLFSPRINSSESMVVEILSPHLAGGSHETHGEEVEEVGEDREAGRELHPFRVHGHNDGQHSSNEIVSVIGAAPAM
ncbi:Moulting cycle MLT-10-like protein family-containing protein [Aphelenchoides besseyi]|nr:Moulting cycle MLT-10-like protein family-containing protein [Aphelenchoides besseyi]KAI6221263.1 Moulting cycle MLT-10-like protein family-containing protein [Aphelenchoides besseyi]